MLVCVRKFRTQLQINIACPHQCAVFHDTAGANRAVAQDGGGARQLYAILPAHTIT